MRPKFFTPRNLILALVAVLIVAGYFSWQKNGGKIPFIDQVPSTAGKIAFVRDGDIYMADGATGDKAVALTNDNKGADAEPAWSENGDTLALTSDRNGVVRQLFITNAVPGAVVAARTKSSTTKEQPIWGAEGDIYFLDGGRISKLIPKTAATDSLFPSPDLKRRVSSEQQDSTDPTHFVVTPDGKQILGKVNLFGGVTKFIVTPDGNTVFATIKQEQGEMLVVSRENGSLETFGIADHILMQYSPDGSFVAVFAGGAPLPFGAKLALSSELATLLTRDVSNDPERSFQPTKEKDSVMVRINTKTNTYELLGPIPFSPTGLALSARGTRVAVTGNVQNFAGVYVFTLDSTRGGGQIVSLPASEPAFSPDGTKIAFVSGSDIYIANVEGGATENPLNLTKGQGKNTSPVWSPAKGK